MNVATITSKEGIPALRTSTQTNDKSKDHMLSIPISNTDDNGNDHINTRCSRKGMRQKHSTRYVKLLPDQRTINVDYG